MDDEEIGAWGVLDEDEFSFWTEDEVADEGPSCDKGVSSDDSIGICEASLEGDGASGLVGSSPQAERPKKRKTTHKQHRNGFVKKTFLSRERVHILKYIKKSPKV